MKKFIMAIFILAVSASMALAWEGNEVILDPGTVTTDVSTQSYITVEDMNAALNKKVRQIKRDELQSRNEETDHHFILGHRFEVALGQIRAAMLRMDDSNHKEAYLLGEQNEANTWLLGVLGALATILILAAAFFGFSAVLRAINSLRPGRNEVITSPAASARATSPMAVPVATRQEVITPSPAPPGTPCEQAAPAVREPAIQGLSAEQMDERFQLLTETVVTSARHIIEEVPKATAALVKKLDPMVIKFTDVSGKKVSYTPDIVEEGGVEWYLTPYVPLSVMNKVGDASQISRVRKCSKGDTVSSTRRAIAEYIALTTPDPPTPQNERERQVIALGDHLKATGKLTIE